MYSYPDIFYSNSLPINPSIVVAQLKDAADWTKEEEVQAQT